MTTETRREDTMTRSETRFVTSADGTRIAYEVSGSGPALVLVDGALCQRNMGRRAPSPSSSRRSSPSTPTTAAGAARAVLARRRTTPSGRSRTSPP